MAVDWNDWLDKPLDQVRRELGLETAPAYREFEFLDAPGVPDDA